MKSTIIKSIKKDQRAIKKEIFENLFKLMMDYQLTPLFGKKGFRLKEHIEHILSLIEAREDDKYINYIRENMLKNNQPEKYLKAVQLILSSSERYFWFWIEDQFPDNLIKNLLELTEIFNSFRDKIAFERFRNDFKMEQTIEEESEKLVEDNRFFLYRKTREIKNYFESVLESTTDAVISTDENGKIVLFNQGAVDMFGYETEEIFHRNTGILYEKPEDAESLKDKLIDKAGRVHSFETNMIRKSGEAFPTLISASLIRNRQGNATGIVRYIKDITDIKELEKELRRLSEFKSKYLHDISHEIKTPVTSIIGFIDIIIKYYDETLDINVKKYIDKIKNTCRILLDLMDTLLDIAKIESGKLELKPSKFNPRELIEDVKVVFLPMMSEKGIDFNTSCKRGMPEIRADRARLRQIIFNLVSNALKYTDEGKKVFLKLDLNNGNLIISVADEGRGIDNKYIDLIFEDFQQIEKEKIDGAGLGLSLVKKLVDLHNGKINVQSEVDKGSKFIVEIPVPIE